MREDGYTCQQFNLRKRKGDSSHDRLRRTGYPRRKNDDFSMRKKIAIIFPGVGYHSDRPLLYFSKKLAKEYQYEIIDVKYSGFPSDLRGNPIKMREAFENAYNQAEKQLSACEFSTEDEILMISKSVGTVVASAYAKEKGISCKNIYFTPVKETFSHSRYECGIVFHGTKEPWANTEDIKEACLKDRLPLFLTENADHSLETGNTLLDIITIHSVISKCQSYLAGMDLWEDCNI